MPTQVEIRARFRRRAKQLGRKYPLLTSEVRSLVRRLEDDERPGSRVPGVGYTVYKVRLPNRAARRGKSGGFRVIYYVRFGDYVVLLTIYSKTDESDISTAEIQALAREADETGRGA